MKKVFQKNQMIIMTLAVVIAVAGYVNYSQKYESAGTKNGKTKTVSKNVAKESAAAVTDDVTDVGEAVLTNAQVSNYVAKAKLEREQVHKEYLSGISEKLDDYSMKYRELYTQCYEEISGYYSTSIQSSLLKGLSKTTKVVGKIVERIPVVGDTQADETLIAAGEKLGDIGTEKIRKQMRQLIERQSNFVRPFIDNIDTVNRLNNNPVQLLVDKDNLYIATIA